MDPNTPLTIAGATYANRSDAVEAFDTIWGAKHEGEFDHMALAVVTKDANGELQVERHDSTAKHLGWAGAALGGALAVAVPPVGVAMVAGGAGGGALIGHFWHTIPKEDVRALGATLQAGDSGVIVVAVNRKAVDIEPLLGKATKKTVVETKAGDLEKVFSDEIAKVTA